MKAALDSRILQYYNKSHDLLTLVINKGYEICRPINSKKIVEENDGREVILSYTERSKSMDTRDIEDTCNPEISYIFYGISQCSTQDKLQVRH